MKSDKYSLAYVLGSQSNGIIEPKKWNPVDVGCFNCLDLASQILSF